MVISADKIHLIGNTLFVRFILDIIIMFTGYRANMLGIRHFYNKNGAATLSYLSATALSFCLRIFSSKLIVNRE